MKDSIQAEAGVEFAVKSLYEALLKLGDKRKARGSGITSLPADAASPKRLLTLPPHQWAFENKLHYTREATFNEDACPVSIGTAAQAMSILNNLVLALLRRRGF